MNFLKLSGWLVVILISCKNKEEPGSQTVNDTITGDASKTATPIALAACYSMDHNRDTALFSINFSDSNFTGRLQYRRFEKDHNDGVVKGIIRDSLLIGLYTFQSEGMTSAREVAFLKKADSLFEGYGEIVVRRDTARFVNTFRLKFLPTPFVKGECSE